MQIEPSRITLYRVLVHHCDDRWSTDHHPPGISVLWPRLLSETLSYKTTVGLLRSQFVSCAHHTKLCAGFPKSKFIYIGAAIDISIVVIASCSSSNSCTTRNPITSYFCDKRKFHQPIDLTVLCLYIWFIFEHNRDRKMVILSPTSTIVALLLVLSGQFESSVSRKSRHTNIGVFGVFSIYIHIILNFIGNINILSVVIQKTPQ